MVTYRTGPVLFNAINSVLQQSTPLELIIVDNGNPAAVLARLQVLEKKHTNVQVITGQGNVGYAAACNLGAKVATARYTALINPDCVLESNCFNNFLQDAIKLTGNWLLGLPPEIIDLSTF